MPFANDDFLSVEHASIRAQVAISTFRVKTELR